jgi:hypothetical protein
MASQKRRASYQDRRENGNANQKQDKAESYVTHNV